MKNKKQENLKPRDLIIWMNHCDPIIIGRHDSVRYYYSSESVYMPYMVPKTYNAFAD